MPSLRWGRLFVAASTATMAVAAALTPTASGNEAPPADADGLAGGHIQGVTPPAAKDHSSPTLASAPAARSPSPSHTATCEAGADASAADRTARGSAEAPPPSGESPSHAAAAGAAAPAAQSTAVPSPAAAAAVSEPSTFASETPSGAAQNAVSAAEPAEPPVSMSAAAAAAPQTSERAATGANAESDASQDARGAVLVTGANRGIGFAAAQQLVDQGREVIVACRNEKKAEDAAAQLRASAAEGALVHTLVLDVANPLSVQAAVAHVRQRFDQRLDCLVNNAGVNTLSWTQRSWDTEFAVNFWGPLQLAQLLVPHMRPGGRIVNVTSCLGQIETVGSLWGGVPDSRGYKRAITGARTLQQLGAITFNPGDVFAATDARCGRLPCPVYKFTKAMLNKATTILARDPRLTRRGITAVAVCPGSCNTDMNPFSSGGTAADGGAAVVFAVQHPDPRSLNGRLFMRGRQVPM